MAINKATFIINPRKREVDTELTSNITENLKFMKSTKYRHTNGAKICIDKQVDDKDQVFSK